MNKRMLRDIPADDLRGRRVLVRVDFNVPIDDAGSVADDTRIQRTLPTLRLLSGSGARAVLLSHLGRPGGAPDPSLSLEPVARRLGRLLDREVGFAGSTVGDDVTGRVRRLEDGEMLVLENTRFHPGEKANDLELAGSWAELGDFFVLDAFGTAHRAHASTVGLPEVIRARGGVAAAGLLVEEELRFLVDALRDPERPSVAVLGGAKISDKIQAVEALLEKMDRLLVGGAMANTFFRALGLETGTSLVEEDRVDTARDLLERAGEALLLPVDCVVADEIARGAATRTVSRDDVGEGEAIGDVGPASRDLFREEVSGSRTVVWNGPLGVFELDAFAEGTMALARAVTEASDAGAITVVGGGDSAAALDRAGLADRITHVSTGGGAFLDLVSGAELPGIEALSDAP